jgi:acyl-CoA synthetase (AMP-forming)/AMP-acid ligase II
MISSFRTFDTVKPEFLRTIAFASEVFPIKQFKRWREALPNARFINLYGPTETTGICCYYEVDREFEDHETLPIGGPFQNTQILLLDENNKVPPVGQQGEICVRGTRLTLGYYRNPGKTAEAFVQNPLNDLYPELIYRTGDLGKLNQRGELEFAGRKDYQIKHMGHRIELGEIEVIVNMHPQVRSACCIFDDVKKKIVLYYTGELALPELTDYIKSKLPRYMIPNVTRQLENLPLTPNGKIDRNLLKTMYEQK